MQEDEVLVDVEDSLSEDESLNHDLEQLIEDSDQYAKMDDASCSVTPFTLNSINKIRDRWGVGDALTVGQEGLGSSLKDMLRRFVAWLKAKAQSATDLWLKFNNLGRTTKRKAERYKVQIMKCKRREKDYVSGNFIMRLMCGRQFIGGDVNAMKESLNIARSVVEAQKRIYGTIVSEVETGLSGGTPKYADALSADGMYGRESKPFNIIGHRTLFAQGNVDELERPYVRLSFPPTLKEDIPPSVFTPKLQLLERLNDFYYTLGRELEREINKQQFVEKTHLKLVDTMEKLLKTIDKAEKNPEKVAAAKLAASYARIAASKAATLNSVGNFTWRNLTIGLGGYIQESIKSFSK